MPLPRPGLPLLIAGLLGATPAAGQPACAAQAAATAPLVVELYTSEGCSSCPPADRWLSTLKGRDGVFPLAFHVDYWDRLGWTDRFASPAWTRRQVDAAARRRSAAVYTPQVLVNGAEHRRWPALPAVSAPAVVALSLQRDGESYRARVGRLPGAPARLAGYWAVTEDAHVTRVRAGENGGATLHHDAVVRELHPVAQVGDAPLVFMPRSGPDPTSGPKPRQVLFVVTDADSGRPLQAARLGC
ncbi:MAG TPA: DUF1223 domain-containing protein [Methylibium sp.]|nr:DUF1223 domain-containing protein [Methylibium sp.]